MVRLVLLLSLFFLFIRTGTAQSPISVDPASFVMTGNPVQTDISYYVHVTNTTNETIHIFWAKSMSNQPSEWLSWICDENLCYEPYINSCPANKPNILEPGESIDLQVHMNPSQVEGTGNYTLDVIDNLGNVIATVSGTMQIDASTAVKDNNEAKLSLFPNPTIDFFEVTEIPGLRYIEVFNIVGNKVRTFDSAPQKQYYVGDLTDGIYLVRLLSSSKKVLKTVRLSKR